MEKEKLLQLLELVNEFGESKEDACMKMSDYKAMETFRDLVQNELAYEFSKN